MKRFLSLFVLHAKAFSYVLTVILPVVARTGRRPVLFSKYSGIGDIICTFPAALELKKRHPGAVCIYNCYAQFSCLPRLAGLTDQTTSFDGIGIIGYWYRWLLGAFYQFVSDDDRPEMRPQNVYIKDFGRSFGVEVEDDHPRLQSTPEVETRMKERVSTLGLGDGSLVVINPGPSWPVREWPEESWNALVHELHKAGIGKIVQIGTSFHALTPGATKGIEVRNVFSLVDQLTLEESIALISQADLFIGIDSGMLHVAAAVQTPSVGIWGPTSPNFRFSNNNARFFVTSQVECQGCHHRVPRLHWMTGCPNNIKCMKKINYKDIFINTSKLLMRDA